MNRPVETFAKRNAGQKVGKSLGSKRNGIS